MESLPTHPHLSSLCSLGPKDGRTESQAFAFGMEKVGEASPAPFSRAVATSALALDHETQVGEGRLGEPQAASPFQFPIPRAPTALETIRASH